MRCAQFWHGYCFEIDKETGQGGSRDALHFQDFAACGRDLFSRDGISASGSVVFRLQPNGGLAIEGQIAGLEPGEHGFHIHETGDCSAPDGSSAGGHFAPDKNPHGAPMDGASQHHAGDLGNIEADAEGKTSNDRDGSPMIA